MEVNMFYNYIFFKKLSNMKSKKKVVKNMLYWSLIFSDVSFVVLCVCLNYLMGKEIRLVRHEIDFILGN
jgi:hypothetical protein